MYVLEASDGEVRRLSDQGAELSDTMASLFHRIGVATGWRCIDLGCGLGDVARLLATMVGREGSVLGIDVDPQILHLARAAATEGVTFLEADACETGLPPDSFDLVHGRFICGATGNPRRLIGEAVRLARPGGTVALEEQDIGTLACYPPSAAFSKLKALLGAGLDQAGAGRSAARALFGMMRQAGLINLRYSPVLTGCQAGDPLADWLPRIVESLRGTLLRNGLATNATLDETLSACRAHLQHPGTTATLCTIVRVWGTKTEAPRGAEAGTATLAAA